MMIDELEVSVLSAPLAAIDRRALSQAWYGALHLSQRASAQRAPRERANPSVVVPSQGAPLKQCRAPGIVSAAQSSASGSARGLRASHDAMPATDPVAAQRVRQRSSRHVELRFSSGALPVARATFSLGRGTARIHVIVQSNGGTARLIAICRPHMREVVARALAQARLALGARGITIAMTSASKRYEQCS